MKKLAKEIPINCKICVHCIQDENGKFFCSFDESNPNLLGLLECHELKLGIISLVEYLEERDKKISALEEKINILEENNEILESNGVNMVNKIEALESVLLEYFKVMWDKKRKPNIGEVKRWIKQLEGKQ